MKAVVCTCGARSIEVEPTSLGETSRKTGFRPILTHEGRVIWLCPACFKQAHESAKVIMNIVKNDFIHFPNLLKEG